MNTNHDKLIWIAALAFILTSCNANWQLKSDCPNPKVGSSAAWGVDPSGELIIYAIGGLNQSIANNLVDGFDIADNSWGIYAPMTTNRAFHAASTIFTGTGPNSPGSIGDVYIYVFGGQKGNVSLNTCEKYDTRNNVWSTINSMTVARHGLAAAMANGKIYVFGGENGSNHFDVVEEYDPQSGMWSTKNPMPEPRAWLGAATGTDGMIYLTGGTSSGPEGDNLWQYNPNSDSYTVKTNMPIASSRHCSESGRGDKIYVLGNVSYEYDISDDQWRVIDEMTCGYRIDLSCQSFLFDIYIIGGYRRFNPPRQCTEVYK